MPACHRTLTCPTIGLLHAAQTPFFFMLTPCRFKSDCKSPSIVSRLEAGVVCTGLIGLEDGGLVGDWLDSERLFTGFA